MAFAQEPFLNILAQAVKVLRWHLFCVSTSAICNTILVTDLRVLIVSLLNIGSYFTAD